MKDHHRFLNDQTLYLMTTELKVRRYEDLQVSQVQQLGGQGNLFSHLKSLNIRTDTKCKTHP